MVVVVVVVGAQQQPQRAAATRRSVQLHELIEITLSGGCLQTSLLVGQLPVLLRMLVESGLAQQSY